MLKKIAFTLMPIRREEISKCISMGMMFFFILFNYDLLRTLKDSLIVPNIGAPAVCFIKMYVVTPSALSLMILYAYLSERLAFEKIFYYIAFFFLAFFLLFGFVLYPHQEFFNPNPDTITHLINGKLNLFFFELKLDTFRWFLKIYGKWTLVTYYVISELWGSAMIFLLFWQFANNTTTTEEAKRLYPAYAFIGHLGALLAGGVGCLIASIGQKYFIENYAITLSLATILSVILFIHNNRRTKGHHIRITVSKEEEKLKPKLSLMDGFKIIFSSKYLGLIIILILAYGTCINLLEGLWRMKVVQIYPNTIDYTYFMSKIGMYIAICALIGFCVSGSILRLSGWLFGALVLPVAMLITGLIFFSVCLFGYHFASYVAPYGVNLLLIAVIVGGIQNAITKGLKYSFFDITKEMAFIPTNHQLRSKGKAAVDVVGSRCAKSIGALIQSTSFMIFPFATYDTLAPYLTVIYVGMIALWIFAIKKLYVAYSHKVEEHQHDLTFRSKEKIKLQ